MNTNSWTSPTLQSRARLQPWVLPADNANRASTLGKLDGLLEGIRTHYP